MTTLVFKTSADAEAYFDKAMDENPDLTLEEVLEDHFIQDYYKGEWKCYDAPIPCESRPSFVVISNIPIEGREKKNAHHLAGDCEEFMIKWMEDNDKEELYGFPYEYYDSDDGQIVK